MLRWDVAGAVRIMTQVKNNFNYAIPDKIDHLRASPRLFDNAVLDKLSRVHWSTPLFVYTPVVVALGVWSFQALSPTAALVAAAVGYLIWTLTEYFGHRFPFHYKHPSRIGRRLHFLIHGVYHDHPNDPLRLVMPVLLSGPIMLIAYVVVRALFGLPYGYPVLMGFIIAQRGAWPLTIGMQRPLPTEDDGLPHYA